MEQKNFIKCRIRLTILIFFLSSTNIFAQPDFSFTGYVVDLPIYLIPGESQKDSLGNTKNQFLNLTRARLHPKLNLWTNARLDVEYEINALYFSSSNDLDLNTSEKSNRQLIDLTWNPVNEEHFNVTHYIDRLYFRQGFDFGNVVIGRQRISWGTGRIWNPTDLFNPINPAVFYKVEKDGADAMSMKYIFGNFTDLNLVFNPQKKIKNSNYGFRFRTNYEEYDMSVMGGSFDNRVVSGLDFAGNLLYAVVRGEGIISLDKDDFDDKFVKFILGIDNQFTPELYALLEYHYNGEGKTDKTQYEFDKLMRGEIQNLNKNYLYIGGFYQYNPLLYFSLDNISNINDGSGFINVSCIYSIEENLSLYAGTQITYGSELSEYWYYPSSLYLELEFYF